MSLLLESLSGAPARRRGAANLGALCAWARHVYDSSARSSQADADVSAFQGLGTRIHLVVGFCGMRDWGFKV